MFLEESRLGSRTNNSSLVPAQNFSDGSRRKKRHEAAHAVSLTRMLESIAQRDLHKSLATRVIEVDDIQV